MRTSDAGQHWDVMAASRSQNGGLPPEPHSGLPSYLPSRPWFGFADPSVGWAYISIAPPPGGTSEGLALYQTTNGGVDWTALSLPELG